MPGANPFTPTFGTVPRFLAGRDLLLQDMESAFSNGPGDPNLSTILIGPRGSGKTALLSCISDEALARGWITANVSAVPGMLDDIIQRTRESAADFLNDKPGTRITGVGIAQLVEVEFTHTEEQPNWRTKMNGLLKQLDENGIGLLITVDEVDANLDEMVLLASVYQHFVRERRKVALVMAGLPYQVSSLLSNKSVSFLRRSSQHHLGRIDDADIRKALAATINEGGKSISDEALDLAVKAIDGFPFMMQLVGYRAWASTQSPAITADDVARGISLANRAIREGVLAMTFDELSAGDVRFLAAMLHDSHGSKLADIATRMGVASNYASQYKRRMLEAGIIDTQGGDTLRFAIPGFKEYLAERV